MLPASASMPLAGTPSSKADKSLRTLFCGAANHLTQLYMSSLKLEKGAMKRGYCKAVEDLIKFLQLQQQYGRTISIDSLVDHLKTKKREIVLREDNDFGDDEEEHEEGDETPVLGGAHGDSKTPTTVPPAFGATARSLTTQFEGLSASGGTFHSSSSSSSSGHHIPRMGSAVPAASATAPAPAVHFGFTSAASSTSAQPAHQQPTGNNRNTSSTSTSTQFPSAAAASTFRDAVSIPFLLAPSAATAASNPFAPPDSSNGNGSGRKRQFFEFFFDAPPDLTLSSATPTDHHGPSTNGTGSGFQFTPTSHHSTSTSISPTAASSSLASSGPTGSTGGGESDGAMDFSCYEHQAWKRFRREDEHTNPAHRTSANTS